MPTARGGQLPSTGAQGAFEPAPPHGQAPAAVTLPAAASSESVYAGLALTGTCPRTTACLLSALPRACRTPYLGTCHSGIQ